MLGHRTFESEISCLVLFLKQQDQSGTHSNKNATHEKNNNHCYHAETQSLIVALVSTKTTSVWQTELYNKENRHSQTHTFLLFLELIHCLDVMYLFKLASPIQIGARNSWKRPKMYFVTTAVRIQCLKQCLII